MKLFIIRHGDPHYPTDSITKRGVEEAEALKMRLLRDNITKVYCSPLGRAQQTAKPFLELTGLSCTTYDFLQEFCVPIVRDGHETCAWCLDVEYYNEHAERLQNPNDWYNDEIYQRHNMKEHVDRLYEQFDALLLENGYKRNGMMYDVMPGADKDANIAIFCHGGLGALLLSRIVNIAPPIFWQSLKMMPTGVTTVLFTDTATPNKAQAQIFTFSDVTHVAEIGINYK